MADSSTSPLEQLGDDMLRTQLQQLRDHLQTTALLGGCIPDLGAAQLAALEAELRRRGLAETRTQEEDVFGLDEDEERRHGK